MTSKSAQTIFKPFAMELGCYEFIDQVRTMNFLADRSHCRLHGLNAFEVLKLMHVEATGLPIAVMQAIVAVRTEGQPTMPERRDLPVARRDAVLAQIAGLPRGVGGIVGKIDRL